MAEYIEREALIELLKAAKKNRGMYSPEGYLMGATFNIPLVDDKYVELLADHLLAEGVIVPPVKVGQTVYTIGWDDNIEEFIVKDIAYEEGNFGVYFYRFRAVMGRESDIHFTDIYIGESVFLTKEEAEKALERSENGKS